MPTKSEYQARLNKLKKASLGVPLIEYAQDVRIDDCVLHLRMKIATKAKLWEKIHGIGGFDLLDVRKAVLGNEKVVGMDKRREAKRGTNQNEAA